MVQYPYQHVMRACPDGRITRLNARSMAAMADAARREAAGANKAVDAAKILMGAARECVANGYAGAARDLYLDAISRLSAYANDTYSHAGRELHYRCARAVDDIERRVYGRVPEPSHMILAREFYMALSLDYEYVVFNYDNYERLRRYNDFCRRHNIE